MVNRLGKILASMPPPPHMDGQVAQQPSTGLRVSRGPEYFAPSPDRSSCFGPSEQNMKNWSPQESPGMFGMAGMDCYWGAGQAEMPGAPPPFGGYAPVRSAPPPLQQFAPAHHEIGAPPEPYHDPTLSFARESVMSYASSVGWQSSCASFASDACGEPSSSVVVGRRAMPHAMALSVVSSCPRQEDGALLSLGSRQHDIGECTPCKFFRSKRGCRDGALCKLCHFPHTELSRSATRRAVRRKGLEKRAFFDCKGDMERLEAQTGMTIKTQNTFLHFQDLGVPTPKDWAAPQRMSAFF
mmetsp:Transcript_65411/g.141318  ORF Transcript_65411/g.141318 Transcript_65411/m.141318 type:complete len:297 (+) Transcript_65411:92-982(+)